MIMPHSRPRRQSRVCLLRSLVPVGCRAAGAPAGVAYLPVLGAELGPGDQVYQAWELIRDNAAAGAEETRAIVERRLAALG